MAGAWVLTVVSGRQGQARPWQVQGTRKGKEMSLIKISYKTKKSIRKKNL